jgi:hypothetical protein
MQKAGFVFQSLLAGPVRDLLIIKIVLRVHIMRTGKREHVT